MNDVGSPPPVMVNEEEVEERPILDEMIARMQQEQDEQSAAGSSSRHRLQTRSTEQRNADHRDQATGNIMRLCFCFTFCVTFSEYVLD